VIRGSDEGESIETATMIDEEKSLHIPTDELASLCRRYKVSELALFGSVVRKDHLPQSDVDLLVSFQPRTRVTFTTLARMQRELESLLGRKVDLVPKAGLKPMIRDHVLATARVLYAA
jgi:predicted nucleotidyltransferase